MMTDINDVINSVELTDQGIDEILGEIEDNLNPAIVALSAGVIALLKDLKTDKQGNILGPKSNIKIVQDIQQGLIQQFEKYYDDGVNKSTKQFDKLSNLIKKAWPDVDNPLKYSNVDKSIMTQLKNQVIDDFIQYGNSIREKITTSLYNNMSSQMPYDELVKDISKTLGTIDSPIKNNLKGYSELWKHDATMNFHQTVKNKKAADTGLTQYLYYGNIIKTSRQFCIHRAGKIYTKEEINSWNDRRWKGKSGPPMIYRGGWNCRHHWTPVKPEWIESDEIEVQIYQDEESEDIDRNKTGFI
jgi:hypothetical protein